VVLVGAGSVVVGVASVGVVAAGVVEVGVVLVVVVESGVVLVVVVESGVVLVVEVESGVVLELDDGVVLDGVVAVGVVDFGGFVARPLSSRSFWIAFCTSATCLATAAGVPAAPRAEIASSFLSSSLRRCSNSSEGTDLIDSTIWSAIAVVMHDGQLTFSAPAKFSGAIVSLCPTISTSWKETATVVQALQLANA
jgi:hypothetical protein